jgi:hypothetical protein
VAAPSEGFVAGLSEGFVAGLLAVSLEGFADGFADGFAGVSTLASKSPWMREIFSSALPKSCKAFS